LQFDGVTEDRSKSGAFEGLFITTHVSSNVGIDLRAWASTINSTDLISASAKAPGQLGDISRNRRASSRLKRLRRRAVVAENFRTKFVPLKLNTLFKFHSCNCPRRFRVVAWKKESNHANLKENHCDARCRRRNRRYQCDASFGIWGLYWPALSPSLLRLLWRRLPTGLDSAGRRL
jgi:hypothetical protein